jgi:dihydroflavonol-4-reductase
VGPSLDGWMSMKIALTGGGGFLGRAICNAWIAHGVSPEDLTVISRRPHPYLADIGVGHRVASVTDAGALKEALQGADVLYHLAGMVSRDPRDAERLRQVHVLGTQTTLDVAQSVGISRVVYASSTGTFGCTDEPAVTPHEDGADAGHLVSQWPYYATKLEAEKIALAPRDDEGMSVIVLNPSLLLGPGDFEGSSTTDISDFLRGRLPAIARGGLNFVDVRDAAEAFVAAAHGGEPGVRHLIGAANMTVAELMGRLTKITKQPGPRMSPPAGVQVFATIWMARFARLFGREPAVAPATAAMAQLFWYASGTRAHDTLGFRTRDLDETLADTVNSLQ